MSIYPNKSLQDAVTLQFCGKAGTYPAQAMNDEISGVPFASNMEVDAVIEMGTPVVWDADGVRPVKAGDSNIYGVACFSYGVLADQPGYRKGNLNMYIPIKRKGYVVVKLDSLQDAAVDAPVTIDAENRCYKVATGSDKVYGRIDTIFPEYGTAMIEMRNIIEIKPVATKASGYLTVNENPSVGQELVVGSTTYHFNDANASSSASGIVTANGIPSVGQELVIGSTTYNFNRAIEAVPATGTITFNSNPIANDTITIGENTYTFVDSATNPNDVALGTDAATTMQNFITVFESNHDAYVSTTDVSSVTIASKVWGTEGNSMVFTTTSSALSLSGSGTLAGGSDAVPLSANDIQIGESANATAANIIAAVNAAEGGAGTMYGAGTVANANAMAFGNDNIVNVLAKTAGTAGNSITFTTDSSNLLLTGDGTLIGGSDVSVLLANDIQIGESINATAMNITAAINAAEGAGTMYGEGTVPNADANATFANNEVHVEAIVAGAAGNSIAFTTNSDGLSLSGSGTLTGGSDAQ